MAVMPQEVKEALQGYDQRVSRAEKCLAGALLSIWCYRAVQKRYTILPTSTAVDHGGNVRLERQVQRWQEAGIIDAATAERIMAHERRASRPVLLLAIGGLGAFTIGVGLLSIIAANWGDIPRLVKLLAMLGLLAANAYGLLRASGRPQRWIREALALGYFALTLVSIALVGQTYQLAGEPYQALLLWLVAASPALWLAEGAFAAQVFLAALVITGAASFDPLVDLLGNDHQAQILVPAGLGAAAVFGPLIVASLPLLRRLRPAFAAVYERLGWSLFVLAASWGVHAWYLSMHPDDVRDAWIGARVVVVFVGLAVWRVQGLALQAATPWLLPARILLVLASAITGLGVLLPHPPIAVAGALGFITVWALVAWCGYRANAMQMVNLATAVIAVRIFMAYVEVFGSMLATGAGLVVSGVLLLALAWLWVRKIRLQPGGTA
jgi:uncharacterized membrane protein